MTSWAKEQRQLWLQRRKTAFQRDDMVRKFRVSRAIISGDIKLYLEQNPGALKYDASKKRYIPVRAS